MTDSASGSNSAVRQLLPPAADSARAEPSGDVDLPTVYAFPDSPAPWVRAVFVSSLDGAATVRGRSRGLSGDTDHRLFALGRALADVLLVGSGTVRAEGYGPATIAPEWNALRAGRPAAPPIAVVSRTLDDDLSAPLFTAAAPDSRTIVLTTKAAPAQRLRAAEAVADVIVAGDELVDLPTGLAALAARGLRRVSCEGGPHLLASVVAAGCLDELCLTLSPELAPGDGPRITDGPPLPDGPAAMRLAGLLSADDYLFLRYVRAERHAAR